MSKVYEEVADYLEENDIEFPEELVDVIAEAMMEWGPDGHCDGAAAIAQYAFAWMKLHPEMVETPTQ